MSQSPEVKTQIGYRFEEFEQYTEERPYVLDSDFKKKIVFSQSFSKENIQTRSCYLKIGNVSRRKCLVSFPVAFHCLHVLSDKESNVRKGRGRGGRPSGKLPEMEGSCKTGPVQADFCFLSFPNVLPKVNHQWLMGLAYSSKADLSW